MAGNAGLHAGQGREMKTIEFPAFSSTRCLMMPYIQGEPESVSQQYAAYQGILASTYLRRGDIGYLTIDESTVTAGQPHRGKRAKYGRALHTEAGVIKGVCGWGGGPVWGGRHAVTLDRDVRVLLASNMANTCAVWDSEHIDTSEDGDIGYAASAYPYSEAKLLAAGELCEIGLFTPHESLPVCKSGRRQFLRIVGAGVQGRESYFTQNPLMS